MKTFRKALLGIALLAPVFAFAHPIAMSGTEALKVLVGSSGNVVATFEGHSAWYYNDLFLVTDDGVANNDIFIFNNYDSAVGTEVDLGSFAVGTELTFRLAVHTTGFSYFTGSGERNADGHDHARVQQGWAPGTTLVSFEDLYGGEFNYNDMSFSFTNTQAALTAAAAAAEIPEPASLVLLGLGLAGAFFARRRQ